ncbi:hypothetical protein ONA70_14940 [Micromonospora yasonensis]|uniref:hypothetical protein n=1 Tax=Micromonospora yasonensis TaxID=1128667 RepID=UPI00222F831C|nr:hypothetical protein [Micromonospora yasonensis]MCW3841395.1 hypothetical protein [Micromonospora yasonensis]
MSVTPGQQPAAPPERPRRALDVALRIAGGVVAVWAGVLAAVLELIFAAGAWELVKGRPDGVSKAVVGISATLGGVAGVVALTVLLGWFAHAAVGTRWAVALAALPWFVVIVAGGVRTAEGDLALTGDNVLGLAMVVAGAVTFAVLGFRQLVAPPPAR